MAKKNSSILEVMTFIFVVVSVGLIMGTLIPGLAQEFKTGASITSSPTPAGGVGGTIVPTSGPVSTIAPRPPATAAPVVTPEPTPYQEEN